MLSDNTRQPISQDNLAKYENEILRLEDDNAILRKQVDAIKSTNESLLADKNALDARLYSKSS